jgi:cytochrome c peroxidase
VTHLATIVVFAVAAAGLIAFEARRVPLGLDAYMPIPDDNPLTADRVALGRRLFFDPILSADGTISCGTCHDPARAFTNGRAIGVGAFGRAGTRSVPAIINRGYGTVFFWDGRAATLEDQVLQPIDNPVELAAGRDRAVARIAADADYRREFAGVFGRAPTTIDLSRALASYVRSILSGASPYDEYSYGRLDALPPQAREGLRLFRGRANCTACHIGPTLTDERFHNTGVAWKDGVLTDEGRFAITGQPQDRGAFKTATLREIARTAPYMHDGSLETLSDVIAFYNRGGHPNPHLDQELRPLNLSDADTRALETFLRMLSGVISEGPERRPQ